MTAVPPKAPRRNEYLKKGNFCRSVLLKLIAPKPDSQMVTSPLDWPFLSRLRRSLVRLRVGSVPGHRRRDPMGQLLLVFAVQVSRRRHEITLRSTVHHHP